LSCPFYTINDYPLSMSFFTDVFSLKIFEVEDSQMKMSQ